jgi:hypothetical protein
VPEGGIVAEFRKQEAGPLVAENSARPLTQEVKMTPRKAKKIPTRSSGKPQVNSGRRKGDPRFDDGQMIDFLRKKFFSNARALFDFAAAGDLGAQEAFHSLMAQLDRACERHVRQDQRVMDSLQDNPTGNNSKNSFAAQFGISARSWYYQSFIDGMDLIWDAAGEGSPDALEFLREEAERIIPKAVELS